VWTGKTKAPSLIHSLRKIGRFNRPVAVIDHTCRFNGRLGGICPFEPEGNVGRHFRQIPVYLFTVNIEHHEHIQAR